MNVTEVFNSLYGRDCPLGAFQVTRNVTIVAWVLEYCAQRRWLNV